MKLSIACFNGIEYNGEHEFLKHIDNHMKFDLLVYNNYNFNNSECKQVAYSDMKFKNRHGFCSFDHLKYSLDGYDIILMNNLPIESDKLEKLLEYLDNAKAKIGYICHGLQNHELYNIDKLKNYIDFCIVFNNKQKEVYSAMGIRCLKINLPFHFDNKDKPVKGNILYEICCPSRLSRFKFIPELLSFWQREKIKYNLTIFANKTEKDYDSISNIKSDKISIQKRYNSVDKVIQSSKLIVENSKYFDNFRMQYIPLNAFYYKKPVLFNEKWKPKGFLTITKDNIEMLMKDEKKYDEYARMQLNYLHRNHDAAKICREISVFLLKVLVSK